MRAVGDEGRADDTIVMSGELAWPLSAFGLVYNLLSSIVIVSNMAANVSYAVYQVH